MISKTATHALKAMTFLAEQPGEFLGAASVAERIGAPQNYLGKLLHSLLQSGIVYSQRGSGGGFRLARPPEAISLFDIVERVDHISRWEGCCLGGESCSANSPCALHDKWVALRDPYLRTLKETTLADLIALEAPSIADEIFDDK